MTDSDQTDTEAVTRSPWIEIDKHATGRGSRDPVGVVA